jgi:hypothetical protein
LRCRECGATYNLADIREDFSEEMEEELSRCRVDRI